MSQKDCAYDTALCNRVWQRVSPEENPYPLEELAGQPQPQPQPWQDLVKQLLLLRSCLRQAAPHAPQTSSQQILHRMTGEIGGMIRRTQAMRYVMDGEEDYPPPPIDEKRLTWREWLRCCGRETERTMQMLEVCRKQSERLCYEPFFRQMKDTLYRQMRQILRLLENTLAK